MVLSGTMQTMWSNFAKNPFVSPAPGWPAYLPAHGTQTLAKLAYQNNVHLWNVVEVAPSDRDDGPCHDLWNAIQDPSSYYYEPFGYPAQSKPFTVLDYLPLKFPPDGWMLSFLP
jgi:hypothetical protein